MKNFNVLSHLFFGLLLSMQSIAQVNELDKKYTPATTSPFNYDTNKAVRASSMHNSSISAELLSIGRGGILLTYERTIHNGFSAFVSIGPKFTKDFVGNLLNTGSPDFVFADEKIQSNEISSFQLYSTPFKYSSSSPIFQLGMRFLDDEFLSGRGIEFMIRRYNETFILPQLNGRTQIFNIDGAAYSNKEFKAQLKTTMIYVGRRFEDFSKNIALGISYGLGLRINNLPTINYEVTNQQNSNWNEYASYNVTVRDNIRKSSVAPSAYFTISIGLGL